MTAGHGEDPVRWYEHVPAVTATVPCDGEEHRVTWRWGKFKLDDHDLGSERAMLMLGGQPCPCLQALQLWGEQFGLRPEQLETLRRTLGPRANHLLPKEMEVAREAGMALSLERAWQRSRYFDQQGRLLERQLRDRAMPALRAHLTEARQLMGCRTIRGVRLKHVAAGQPTRMEGLMDSVSVSATASLSSRWIVDVWAAGLASVPGAFVLEVTGRGSAPGSLAVRAVRWERQPSGSAEPVAAPMEVVRTEEGWRTTEAGPAR
ncbi:MAG TPA: hypothetical protein VM390_05170 [Acidimicrobiales bacterium]|jgi:hypothetical protein|nr:hypothetical protein [Acidimicrobiales bacterium]